MELMVIVAVIAIVAAVSVAGYSRLVERTRLIAAANDIKGDLQLAKLTAVRRHIAVLAYFDGDGGGYDLRESGDSPFLTRELPQKVAIVTPPSPISFNTMGLSPSGGSVTVGIDGSSNNKIITVSVAGNITLAP